MERECGWREERGERRKGKNGSMKTVKPGTITQFVVSSRITDTQGIRNTDSNYIVNYRYWTQ